MTQKKGKKAHGVADKIVGDRKPRHTTLREHCGGKVIILSRSKEETLVKKKEKGAKKKPQKNPVVTD